MKNLKSRFLELDVLRGVAVVGMIIFHAVFILDFYGVLESEMRAGFWEIFGNFVRWIFLGLVGVGMAVSYERGVSVAVERGRGGNLTQNNRLLVSDASAKFQAIRWQWHRAIIVFGAGLLVSLVTAAFLPGAYVRFGILHLIGFSIFVLSFLLWNRWLALSFAAVTFWLYHGFDVRFFNAEFRQGVDYFPFFPWMGFVALGIFLGFWLYPHGRARFELQALAQFWPVKFLTFFGQNALLIYLLHVPVIAMVFIIFGLISLG